MPHLPGDCGQQYCFYFALWSSLQLGEMGFVWTFEHSLQREHVYGDEQSAFDCNTKETGCPNACYSGLSHNLLANQFNNVTFSFCADLTDSFLGRASDLCRHTKCLFRCLLNWAKTKTGSLVAVWPLHHRGLGHSKAAPIARFYQHDFDSAFDARVAR